VRVFFLYIPQLITETRIGILFLFHFLSAQIEEQIRTELAVQVRAQVALQLAERGIPPSTLHEQAAESKRQLAEVRCSLVNRLV